MTRKELREFAVFVETVQVEVMTTLNAPKQKKKFMETHVKGKTPTRSCRKNNVTIWLITSIYLRLWPGNQMTNIKSINASAIKEAKVGIIDSLIFAAKKVIEVEGDITITYSQLVTAYEAIKANEQSKGEG